MSKKSYQLTWRPREHRWQKKFKKKPYYISVDVGSTKEGSYPVALKRWEIMKGRLLAGLPPTDEPVKNGYPVTDAISKREQLRDIALAANDSAAANSLQDQIDELSVLPPDSQVDRWTYDPLRHISEQGRAVWSERSRLFGKEGCNNSRRIRASIKEYQNQRKVEIGLKVSNGTVRTSNIHLDRFLLWLKADIPLSSFNETTLNDYSKYLTKEVSEQRLTPRYGNHLLASLKQFIRWATELNYMNPPKNLSSKRHSLRVESSEIITIDQSYIQELLKIATPSVQLFILLGLNCGFTQRDIATLLQKEVDWTAGIIKRKRTKSRHITKGNVPIVSYKLWIPTFTLLKSLRSSSDLVLNSGALRFEEKIARDFKELQKKEMQAEKTYSFKYLRKTGASLLATSPNYAHFDEYYLGHTPKTVATRHYTKPSDDLFFKALKWMGEELGIV